MRSESHIHTDCNPPLGGWQFEFQAPTRPPKPRHAADAGLARSGPGRTGYCAWHGASGRLYSARIFELVDCRAPHRGAYVLVSRAVDGQPAALFAGIAGAQTPTENLARIRLRAARLGATEVHLIDVTHRCGSSAARRLVRDIRAALQMSP